ncbi:MAG: right-handed parallel beta-helix repeat-containing protein [Dysgonamonadaceae bacterium]|jgi:hypothetical protein|nr:right-handed parallel beta-helix repeat-containing protein [Dysgonamonadaceae bacterium]
MKKLFLFLLSIILSLGYAGAQTRYYVNGQTGSNYGQGVSWGDAFAELTTAYDMAVAGDEIWIAGGEYDGIYTIIDGVNIYGSFAGTETSIDEREKVTDGEAWEFAHPTVLTSSSGGYIFTTSAAGTSIFDGLTLKGTEGVTSGNKGFNIANGGNNKGYTIRNCIIRDFNSAHDGGGLNIRAKTEIANCLITNNTANKGGGAYLDCTTIHHCKITNNSAATTASEPLNSGVGGGGGLLMANTAPGCVAYNCWIERNTASFGGGLVVRAGSKAYNCIIVNNTASQSGGGLAFDQRDNGGAVFNVTIANNTAQHIDGSGGICFSADAANRKQDVYNSILYKNKNGSGEVINLGIFLSKAEASTNHYFMNNILDDPENYLLFIDESCINESNGTNLFEDEVSYVTKPGFPGQNKGLVTTDLPAEDITGKARVIKNIVDIGPYEMEEKEQVILPNSQGVIFVDLNTTVSDDPYVIEEIGSTWATAVASFATALSGALKYQAENPEASLQLWFKAGTYENISIELKDGISLYGGFAGTETTLAERTKGNKPWIYTHETVLQGVGRDRTAGSDLISSTAVLKQAAEFTSPVVIDGFTITNGEHGVSFISGGNTTLCNSIIRENGNADATTTSSTGATGIDGGGIAIRGGTFVVKDCLIENNRAKNGGGIIIANDAPSLVERCTIRDNKALTTISGDGVMYNFIESSTSVFGWGGGVFNQGGAVNNCLIEGNESFAGGGILVRDDLSQYNNCIIVNNKAIFGGGVGYDSRGGNVSANAGIYNALIADNMVLPASYYADYLTNGAVPETTAGLCAGAYFTSQGQVIYNSIFTGNKDANQTISITHALHDYDASLKYAIVDDEQISLSDGTLDVSPSSITYDADWRITSTGFPGRNAGYGGDEMTGGNPTTTDYAGNVRVHEGSIDIGPYEIDAPSQSSINRPTDDVQGTVIDVRYYNLQGIEIAEPVRGEIYIEKKIYDTREVVIGKRLKN